MKLFHTIIIYDAFVVGNTWEDATETALHWIREEKIKPSEQTAPECRSENEIRDSWKAQSPFVSNAISDEDFKKLKGKTTMDIYQMLYKKAPAAPAPTKPAPTPAKPAPTVKK